MYEAHSGVDGANKELSVIFKKQVGIDVSSFCAPAIGVSFQVQFDQIEAIELLSNG